MTLCTHLYIAHTLVNNFLESNVLTEPCRIGPTTQARASSMGSLREEEVEAMRRHNTMQLSCLIAHPRSWQQDKLTSGHAGLRPAESFRLDHVMLWMHSACKGQHPKLFRPSIGGAKSDLTTLPWFALQHYTLPEFQYVDLDFKGPHKVFCIYCQL